MISHFGQWAPYLNFQDIRLQQLKTKLKGYARRPYARCMLFSSDLEGGWYRVCPSLVVVYTYKPEGYSVFLVAGERFRYFCRVDLFILTSSDDEPIDPTRANTWYLRRCNERVPVRLDTQVENCFNAYSSNIHPCRLSLCLCFKGMTGAWPYVSVINPTRRTTRVSCAEQQKNAEISFCSIYRQQSISRAHTLCTVPTSQPSLHRPVCE